MAENRIYHRSVPIDNLQLVDAVNAACKAASNRTKNDLMVTLEVDGYFEGITNPSYRRILDKASLVVPGSVGLSIYSRIFGPKLHRTTGHIVAPLVLEKLAQEEKTIVLVGSSPESRRIATGKLKAKYKTRNIHCIEGEYSYDNSTDSNYVAEEIDKHSPHFVFMAYNQISAEFWIDQYILKNHIKLGLIGNFGQTLDHISGFRKCPPLLFDKIGLNWAYMLPVRTPHRRKLFYKECIKLATLMARRDLEREAQW